MEEHDADDDADGDEGHAPYYPDRRNLVVRVSSTGVPAAAHGEGGSPADEPS